MYSCYICRRRMPRMSIHRFPQDGERRRSWLRFCNVPEDEEVGENARLCGAHFRNTDFLLNDSRTLKPDAIPTLFRNGVPPDEEIPRSVDEQLVDEQLNQSFPIAEFLITCLILIMAMTVVVFLYKNDEDTNDGDKPDLTDVLPKTRCCHPAFIVIPKSLFVIEGSRLTFQCGAVGQPIPMIHWLKNGHALEPDTKSLSTDEIQNSGTSILLIKSVQKSDDGNYECVASNDIGYIRAIFTVKVLSAANYEYYKVIEEDNKN